MEALQSRIAENAKLVSDALAGYFASRSETELYQAMAYSVTNGGKRIRPFLTLEFCRLFGAPAERALPYACAIEMVHNFSLIHDDLPCMDNDDLRRGLPTCHKKFGEAQALLAGDALIFSAFSFAATAPEQSAEARVRAVRILSEAAGADGMCEGQMLDMESEAKRIPFERLLQLHAYKTGALMRAAAQLGVTAAGGDSSALTAAGLYGEKIGLAFQIVDDILDATSTTEALGKPTGSDAKNQKTTFLSFMSVKEAEAYAKRVSEEACSAICGYSGAEMLCALPEYLLFREN